MRFSTGFPGVTRYPPNEFERGGDNWQQRLTAADFQRIATVSEKLGYDAINVPEHIVMPKELADAMGGFWPDAFTVMSFIAGATSTIRVNSSVIVLPYHHPIRLAKAVATLDLLSGGRVTITVGVGMARGEFAALGVPFAQRGAIADEYIDAMKLLWTQDDPAFHGRFTDFADIVFEPKPVQSPHPPLWVGGSSMAALRRAARVGDGWMPSGSQGGKGPWLNSVDDLPIFLEEARCIPGFAERESTFDIVLTPVTSRFGPNHESLPADRPLDSSEHLIDRIGTLRDAGVTWTSIPRLGAPPRSIEDYLEGLEWAAREVIPHLR